MPGEAGSQEPGHAGLRHRVGAAFYSQDSRAAPLQASRALTHDSLKWQPASPLPFFSFSVLFLPPSFWAGSPRKFKACLQTLGVRRSCLPHASLVTSHPHTSPAIGDISAVPRAGTLVLGRSSTSRMEGRGADVGAMGRASGQLCCPQRCPIWHAGWPRTALDVRMVSLWWGHGLCGLSSSPGSPLVLPEHRSA